MKWIDPYSDNAIVATGLAPAFALLGVFGVLFVAGVIGLAYWSEAQPDPIPGPIQPACVQIIGSETNVVPCPPPPPPGPAAQTATP